MPIDGLDYFVTASIGVSLSGPDAQTSLVLLRSADVAMHTAKSRGRGCLTVFTDAMHAKSSRHLDVHRRLRAAIESHQVRVHYQPVIELRSNHIVGVEALARWTDPDLGQIAPTEFIGVAEESGLIVPLGRHLVELAVQDISRLERLHPLVDLTLAVNVSAKELTLPGYTQSLRSTLAACDFDPAKLIVELTETSLVADPINASQVIDELRRLGARVAIDDFGTGFSSLQTVRDYPIDFLKIHSSFISGADSKANWAIVASIISLANSVGAHAVAEGVETVPQLQALRRLRCEHAQGFYWAPSMPIEELNAWIEANDRRTHRARLRR
jgi:EAL domain-containing protein (putative c-di-GMP-specific phosphodiesterase class I)